MTRHACQGPYATPNGKLHSCTCTCGWQSALYGSYSAAVEAYYEHVGIVVVTESTRSDPPPQAL